MPMVPKAPETRLPIGGPVRRRLAPVAPEFLLAAASDLKDAGMLFEPEAEMRLPTERQEAP